VVKNSDVRAGDKMLDIGCGTGLLSLKFLQAADCFVTAVDNTKEMLSLFEEKIEKLKIEKKVACKFMDADALNFSANTFDIAASTVTLHHLKDKLSSLKKMRRILRPGGRLLIGEIDMDTTGSHTDINRFRRVIKVLEQEWISALRAKDLNSFVRLFNNGLKHILNQGEYCISLKQWGEICKKAGFRKVSIKKIHGHKCFGVVIAEK
jgi:ubiquinone/menaquinone biosynthesis C-methylase UbiE